MRPTHYFVSIAALFLPFGAAAQDRATIIGGIADGNPPPIAPRPELPAVEIRESREQQLPGRTITFNRIADPNLPSPRPALPQQSESSEEQIEALRSSPEFQERITEAAKTSYLWISATVVDHRATYLVWWHGGKEYRAWSNADWMILTGFVDWEKGSRRFTTFLMAGRLNSTKLPVNSTFRVPEDLLPTEPATFRVIQGDDNPEAYIGIIGLHELYQNDYARLKNAFVLREQREKERALELSKNPPKPQNIVLNYWKVQSKRETGTWRAGKDR